MVLVDWFILFVYVISTIAVGLHCGRKQSATNEYFIGLGRMNPFLIGVSLFVTRLSTISYLAIPGELQGKGPGHIAIYLAHPFNFLVLAFVILPVYMRNRVTNAYELLEQRLGLSVRPLGAGMFLVLRLVWMSLPIHLTANALAIMIVAREDMVSWIVVATAVFAMTYTSVGGLPVASDRVAVWRVGQAADLQARSVNKGDGCRFDGVGLPLPCMHVRGRPAVGATLHVDERHQRRSQGHRDAVSGGVHHRFDAWSGRVGAAWILSGSP